MFCAALRVAEPEECALRRPIVGQVAGVPHEPPLAEPEGLPALHDRLDDRGRRARDLIQSRALHGCGKQYCGQACGPAFATHPNRKLRLTRNSPHSPLVSLSELAREPGTLTRASSPHRETPSPSGECRLVVRRLMIDSDEGL